MASSVSRCRSGGHFCGGHLDGGRLRSLGSALDLQIDINIYIYIYIYNI